MKNIHILLISLIYVLISCNSTTTDNNKNDDNIRVIYNTEVDTLIEYYKNGNIKLKRIKDTLQKKMIIYDYYRDGMIKKYSIAYKTGPNKYNVFFERKYIRNGKIKDTGNMIGVFGHFYNNNQDTRELMVARPPNCMYFLGVKRKEDTSYAQLRLVNNIAISKFTDTTERLELIYLISLKDTIRDTTVFAEMEATINTIPISAQHK